ncbi:MAG: glycosyltransferase family 4 protein [Gemmatimonadota bacterium]
MRHLFVTQDYAPDLGGMARRHVELCRRFAPDEVTVSTVGSPTAATFDQRESYPIIRQPFTFAGAKRFANQLAWSQDIARRCRAGVDVVHLGNIRPCGYAVQLATRRVPTPYLVYVYGGDLLREKEKTARSMVKRWSGRDIFARAVGVVAISHWSAALALEVMALVGVRRPPPVAAIDLGTDPRQFDSKFDTGALRQRFGIGDAPLALTVARLVPHKGQDTAIRAIAALGTDAAGMHLLLVGDGGDAERLLEIARSLGMAARVHLTGPLPDAEIAEAYATADVYLGLSRVDRAVNAEGFGLSFVEAAASGTPSIAGDSGGVRSAVRDGETGFVVHPTDVEAVAAALRRFILAPALGRSMGAAGRRAVEIHYNWDRVARETLDFTRQCVAASRNA